MKQLAERLETVERAFKTLQLDWEDTYDRIRVTMARINKRARVVEAAERKDETNTGLEVGAPPAPEANGSGSPLLGRLTDRQRAINAQILRRRGGG